MALHAAVRERLATFIGRQVIARTPDALVADPARYGTEVERMASASASRVLDRLYRLAVSDIDEQATTPLEVVRGFVVDATAFLEAHDVPPAPRDRFSRTRFPNDLYDLTPANLSALGEEVGERSIVWGATKAFEHRRRHDPGQATDH